MCEWVKEAWKELSVQLIKKSFLVCGVTASVDGTDDDQIECMKEGRAAAAAKPLVLTKTQALQKEGIEDDEDPFADLDSSDDEDTFANQENEHTAGTGEGNNGLEVFEESSDDEHFVGHTLCIAQS